MDFAFSSDLLNWKMNLVDIDANDASTFKVNLDVVVMHPTGKFSFVADDIWLEADEWDRFEAGLKGIADPNSKSPEFNDMSRYFTLSVVKQKKCLEVNFAVREPLHDGGAAKLTLSGNVGLDSRFIDDLYGCFNNWPKHW